MDRGPWRATGHGVAKSQTRLSNLTLFPGLFLFLTESIFQCVCIFFLNILALLFMLFVSSSSTWWSWAVHVHEWTVQVIEQGTGVDFLRCWANSVPKWECQQWDYDLCECKWGMVTDELRFRVLQSGASVPFRKLSSPGRGVDGGQQPHLIPFRMLTALPTPGRMSVMTLLLLWVQAVAATTCHYKHYNPVCFLSSYSLSWPLVSHGSSFVLSTALDFVHLLYIFTSIWCELERKRGEYMFSESTFIQSLPFPFVHTLIFPFRVQHLQ